MSLIPGKVIRLVLREESRVNLAKSCIYSHEGSASSICSNTSTFGTFDTRSWITVRVLRTSLNTAEECTAPLEVDGVSLEGAAAGSTATLGTGFAAGALYAKRVLADVVTWTLTFRIGAAAFPIGVCLERVVRPRGLPAFTENQGTANG